MSLGRGADTLSDPETTPASLRERVFLECLDSFPEVTFAVTGQCMRPDLAEGQRVLLVGRARKRPRLGDVVLTRAGGTMRLHRLVWTPISGARGAFRTKADRAAFLDPAVSREDVLGTVVGVEGRAYARRPWRALRSLLSAVFVRGRAFSQAARTAR